MEDFEYNLMKGEDVDLPNNTLNTKLSEWVKSMQKGKKQPTNAIFYQVIKKSLQKNIVHMIKNGEFGNDVRSGDIYLLRSSTTDDYTILLHLIQVASDYRVVPKSLDF